MDKKLFIGGIPFSFTDQSLASLFAECGTVLSAQVIVDRETQRSKGFGFVEMSSEEEAQAAIQKLNNTNVEGRTIVVNIARPKEERPANRFNSRGGGNNFRNNGRQNRY